ncbi:tripartite tricarboxylate transporter TctB family protein [Paenibacillus hodogayensis]|uniref:Tripartite tricarboxylate transporter TctB family protein n=1 Tax=Paenibacillus hodogayensis TaxID=279208 RepID=A0ABV5VY75_9BACL
MKASRFFLSIVSGFVPLAVGLFFFILSRKLSFGTWSNPGPGLWPTCLSALILLASLALIASKRVREDKEAYTRESRFPLYGVLSLAAFILLFERLGATLPCFALFLFWIRFLGKERWIGAVACSAGITAVLYLIFAWGLHIPFPEDKLLLLFR